MGKDTSEDCPVGDKHGVYEMTEDDRREAFEKALKMRKLRGEVENAKDDEVDEKVREYLAFGKSDSQLRGGLFYARLTWKEWERIREASTDELMRDYISFCVDVNFPEFDSISTSDCQMHDLTAIELRRRKVDFQKMKMEVEKRVKAVKARLRSRSDI